MASTDTNTYIVLGHEVVSKVVGVAFDGRQDTLKKIAEGDVVYVRPNPHPKHPQAMSVLSKIEDSFKSIGWLPRDLADIVHENFQAHPEILRVLGSVLEVTGSFSYESNLGLVIGFTMPSGKV